MQPATQHLLTLGKIGDTPSTSSSAVSGSFGYDGSRASTIPCPHQNADHTSYYVITMCLLNGTNPIATSKVNK